MRFVLAALLVVACGGGPAPTPAPAPAAGPPVASDGSLYRRLGGYDAIAAVVDDFLGRWFGDPVIAPFFADVDDLGKQHVRQMVVDQLCAATGGPCYYVGLDMATAHEAVAITPAVWNTAVQHILATLDAFNVPSRERRELNEILVAVRAQILGGA